MKTITAALHLLGRGFLFSLVLAGCRPASPSATVAPAATPSPTPATKPTPAAPPQITGLRATLEDEVTDLPEERIKWNTYWVLSWDPFPGAEGYDLQIVTSEGISPRLHHVKEPRFRLQSATGENLKSEGLVKRDLQLALHAAQLAIAVRAHLPGDQATAWSHPYDVGKTTEKK